jgi:hypothetical protein
MADAEVLSRANLSPLAEAASEDSMAAQRRYLTATAAHLTCLVLAALFGALTFRPDPSGIDLAGAAAVGFFASAALLSAFLFGTRPDRQWYDGRAAAESMKTLAWKYSVGGSPFRVDAGDEAGLDSLFVERTKEIIRALKYAKPGGGRAEPQITDAMRRVRSQPLEGRRAQYRERVGSQQRWYAEKAQWNNRRATAWRAVVLAVEVAGVFLGLLKVAGAVDLDLLGVAAALATALGAWLQAKRHEELGRAYAVASQELGAILSLVDSAQTEADWAAFVDQSEEAISREHTLWRASRGVDPGPNR